MTPSRPIRLRISEIFHSLQGESTRVGLPTVFVRLTGCPLRCVWCDTEYAFTGGQMRQLDDILAEVASHGAHHVCVTGGEPLAQKPCLDLLRALCDAGYSVSLETSGALDVSEVDPRVSRIMDLKAPGSGEADKNLWSNLVHLGRNDEIKIIIASAEDYAWACDAIREHALGERCTVLLSPAAGQVDPQALAAWILRDRLPVRMQLQMHRIIWGERTGV
ncbi:MAG: 7-carboxy-7-deazaguanine synthase QueE [Candidatus Dactylopiibacterium sp.]|nr:7-carboxy-7-deazaguanine synthase QueE [Candidatus Dactylopiibacterium sp.]